MSFSVKQLINTIYPISQHAFCALEGILKECSVKRGEIFINNGAPNFNEYFLIDGICKSFVTDPSGHEVTLNFFKSNTVLTPHSVRTYNKVSTQNFKALTNIKLVKIDAVEFEKLRYKNTELRNFAQSVLQNELIAKSEKEILLASSTAKNRLLHFRKKYPSFENQIPHTDIASYLGITNVSLSRLRKEVSE